MKEINWKFDIGDVFTDNKRNLIIIDKEIRQRVMKKI